LCLTLSRFAVARPDNLFLLAAGPSAGCIRTRSSGDLPPRRYFSRPSADSVGHRPADPSALPLDGWDGIRHTSHSARGAARQRPAHYQESPTAVIDTGSTMGDRVCSPVRDRCGARHQRHDWLPEEAIPIWCDGPRLGSSVLPPEPSPEQNYVAEQGGVVQNSSSSIIVERKSAATPKRRS